MRLPPPETVWKLQKTLHGKAKDSPNYRFYALYDKMYREDVLCHAYRLARSNDGAPGVDGVVFDDIEEYGRMKWLGELADELRTKRYQPQAVLRDYVQKANGKQRPLGIPTIKDRVVQTALVQVLMPIFEADLQPEQHAYRPRRSAHDALRQVKHWLDRGHREVVDADLSGYFDSIPHAELMKSVSRRISDGTVLHLIKMWLEAPVEEKPDGRGHRRRTTANKDQGRGTPQGAPISPLLSNLYMRRFVLGWKTLGHERRLRAKIVNYADDFVIMCRSGADEAMEVMREMMGRLKLTVNEEKTRLCRLPEESFDFLGYTFGRLYSPRTGGAFINGCPSKRKMKEMFRKVTKLTGRESQWMTTQAQVTRLNRLLSGWSNYFRVGSVAKSRKAVDHHTRRGLRRWLCKKHKVRNRGTSRFPAKHLYEELELLQLSKLERSDPWA
jgi:RNA-directed DNA polymerase